MYYYFRRNNVLYVVSIIRKGQGGSVLIRSIAGAWLLEEWTDRAELEGPFKIEALVDTLRGKMKKD